MTNDPRDRNGRDYPSLVVPQVIEHPRARPIAASPLPTLASEREARTKLSDALLQVVHGVNSLSEQMAENTAQLIALTNSHNRMALVVERHDVSIRDTQESVPDTDEIREVVQAVKNEDKAEELDEIKTSRRAIRNGIAIGVCVAAIVSVTTFLIGRSTAPANTTQPAVPAAH